jgi:hypothetical protein
MPLIYQGKCSACDYATRAESESYAAVIVDSPSSSMYVHPEIARLVILAHPGESRILEGLGYTLTAAAIGGRLVYVTSVSCDDCGTMYELRRLDANSSAVGCTGCLAMLALSGCVGAAVGWMGQSYLLGLLAGGLVLWLMIALADFAISRFVRWRYKELAREFNRDPGCPKCQSRKYVTFPPRRGKLVCPKCGQRAVQVDSIGIS